MAVIDTGSSAAGKANVDTAFNLNTTLPRLPTADSSSGVGFAAICGKNDDGAQIAGGRINRAYVAEGNRLAVANPVLLWDDTFNAIAQNTAKYRFAATTMTGAISGGNLILNNSGITTINTNAAIQTFKHFPLFGKSELRCNVSAMLTSTPQVNCVIEFGLFYATLPGGAAPTDGVFFRYNAAGELRGVSNFNTTETQTAAMTIPSASVNHDYVIVCQTNTVLFYIDDVLAGKITLLTDAPSAGQPMLAGSAPFTARIYIGGSAPGAATQLRISDLFIAQLGSDPGKDWATQKAGFGHMASQGQNGGTMGSTALYTNSLAPGAGAAMTNTTAALGSGLGGQFTALPTLAANTDGILCSFQNPQGTPAITPRNLIIHGVTLKGIVAAALTGGPVFYLYSLAYGHTAVSMATAETGSFVSGTTKAPRRIPLGIETYVVTAPAGTLGQGVSLQFKAPIVVAPGEFIAVCAKNIGTVTTVGTILVLVAFDAYLE